MNTRTESFKAAVLKHITEVLPEAEWRRLRQLRFHGYSPYPDAEHTRAVDYLPMELVKMACTEEGLDFAELVSAFPGEAIEVGQAADAPVFYFPTRGIYAWENETARWPLYAIWLTYPAYPPGW